MDSIVICIQCEMITTIVTICHHTQGFPGGLDCKESACSVGEPSLITGSGRSPGGEHGNPPQYSCLEISMDRGAWVGYSPWGPKQSDTTELLSHTHKLI